MMKSRGLTQQILDQLHRHPQLPLLLRASRALSERLLTSRFRPLIVPKQASYSELASLLKRYIPLGSRVLMSGCGNSEFSEDMVKDGFKEIINIDISSVVIEAMEKKYQHLPQLKYMAMDVLDMSYFEKCSFDCVIDKGTLDAIMCVAGGPYNIAMMLAEIARLLKPGGVYMLISFAGPQLSLPLLNRDAFGWSIDSHVLYKRSSGEGCSEAYSEPIPINVEDAHMKNQMAPRFCLGFIILRQVCIILSKRSHEDNELVVKDLGSRSIYPH
ncbi:hypothetical protein GOP47_0008542 [Adiantum capillus-veneris]|uniref:Methyltransferase type 11 domain-containing protein n=1 Tax=Adiantum capillus-veneris TaxID=13818 RepID=A0A9D4ZJU1_ADICA|nr:hypothetical protein GOP47_0008542 [Adiantum capillus-veneris]